MRKRMLKSRSKEYQRGYKAGYAKAMRNIYPSRQPQIVHVSRTDYISDQLEREAYRQQDTRIGGSFR